MLTLKYIGLKLFYSEQKASSDFNQNQNLQLKMWYLNWIQKLNSLWFQWLRGLLLWLTIVLIFHWECICTSLLWLSAIISYYFKAKQQLLYFSSCHPHYHQGQETDRSLSASPSYSQACCVGLTWPDVQIYNVEFHVLGLSAESSRLFYVWFNSSEHRCLK